MVQHYTYNTKAVSSTPAESQGLIYFFSLLNPISTIRQLRHSTRYVSTNGVKVTETGAWLCCLRSRGSLSLEWPIYANVNQDGARPCGAIKVAKSCKEGTAANLRQSGSEGLRFKSQCQQGLFTVESPL